MNDDEKLQQWTHNESRSRIQVEGGRISLQLGLWKI